MNHLKIIDSHVHLWDPARLNYAWLAGTELERTFGTDELRRATADSTAGFVTVQADCAAEQALSEVDWLVEQMQGWCRLSGVVAFAPVELGRAAEPFYRRLQSRPQVRGIRRLIQGEPPGFALDPQFLAGLNLLDEIHLPFDACVRESQLAELVDVVRRVPQVQLVLDHLGKPRVGGSGDKQWRTQLSRLAQQPNVTCKLSGLTTETGGAPWRSETVRPYLEHALQVFGPARCMFGSDWPVLTTAARHRQWVDAVLDALSGFSAAEIEQVMYGTARSVYSLAEAGVDSRDEAMG